MATPHGRRAIPTTLAAYTSAAASALFISLAIMKGDRHANPDLWGELFMRIDRTLLLVSVGDSPILGPVCEWLLYEIKEPLHTVVYDLGWTRYVPVSRITVDEILSWFD